MNRPGDCVIVLDTWRRVLVYHEARSPYTHRVELPDGFVANTATTACGVELWHMEWRAEHVAADQPEVRVDRRRSFSFMRRDHCEQIGRPCKRCEVINGS